MKQWPRYYPAGLASIALCGFAVVLEFRHWISNPDWRSFAFGSRVFTLPRLSTMMLALCGSVASLVIGLVIGLVYFAVLGYRSDLGQKEARNDCICGRAEPDGGHAQSTASGQTNLLGNDRESLKAAFLSLLKVLYLELELESTKVEAWSGIFKALFLYAVISSFSWILSILKTCLALYIFWTAYRFAMSTMRRLA